MTDYLTSITRLPERSRLKRLPRGTTVVALYSVTTAGPEYFFPVCSRSRAWIAVVTLFPPKTTDACSGRERLDPVRAGSPVVGVSMRLATEVDFMVARSR